jgi:DinB superfamily
LRSRAPTPGLPPSVPCGHMDPFLIEITPGPTLPLAPVVGRARATIGAAAGDLLSASDAILERPWPWRGEEADIRYGLYYPLELIEAAEGEVHRILESAERQRTLAGPAPASVRIGPATTARWDLHGLLVGLDEAVIDADPGGGEWTVRQTLGHIVSGQRGYAIFSGWWLTQRGTVPFPTSVPDSLGDRLPDEHGPEMAGSLAEIRARLDEVLDDAASRLGSLDDEALAARARWSGIEVDIGFRLGRWSSHIQEHTVQVEKTLATVGHTPTEVERVVRLVLAAYGRLEALVFARDPGVMDAPDDRGLTIADVFRSLDSVAATAASVKDVVRLA